MSDPCFAENGFCVVEEFLPQRDVVFLDIYTKLLKPKYEWMREDLGEEVYKGWLSRSADVRPFTNPENFNLYADPAVEALMFFLLEPVSKIVGHKVLPSYSYFREYFGKGSYLTAHKDRPSCEISVSANITGGEQDWPFCLEDRKGKTHEVLLKPGMGLVYLGHDLLHWRPEKETEGPYKQVFFHFVSQSPEKNAGLLNEII